MGVKGWIGSKSKSLIGIDIGSSRVKVAALKSNGTHRMQLQTLASKQLPEDAIVDGVIIAKLPVAEAIESIFTEYRIRNRRVATAISGHSVIVKRITLPALSKDELDQSIQWEAEQYIPFDITDVNLDYQVVREAPNEQKLEVVLVAAKKEKITDYTSVISMAGKVPEVVDIDAFALQNIYEANYAPDDQEVVALLNIGAHVMNVNIARGRDFLFTRDIALGGAQYTEFLGKELGIDLEEAERYKTGEDVPEELIERVDQTVESVSENMALEVEKTFDYFKTTTGASGVNRVYLSGGACRTSGLKDYMGHKLGVPVDFLDPLRKIKQDKRSSAFGQDEMAALDYAVALGLALRTMQDR